MVLVLFWGMGNHLGSYKPEGQEAGGGDVGSQEVLQNVKLEF